MDIRHEFADLVELDAARDVGSDPATHAARVESIVSAEPARSGTGTVSALLPRRRRTGRRAAVLMAAAAVVAVVGTGASILLGNGSSTPLGPSRAYGAWRPAATAISGSELHRLVTRCTAMAEQDDKAFVANRAAVAELHGRWATIVLSDARGRVSGCLTNARTEEGSTSTPDDPTPNLGPTAISSDGAFSTQDNGAGNLSITGTFGQVGRDVTAVTLHLTTGVTVKATVTNGLYAASYPDDGTHRVIYTLTLRNGSTIERDELGNLAGTSFSRVVQVAAAQRLPASMRQADHQCRLARDIPAGDTSAYHAARPWYTRPGHGDDPILFYVTDNGRQAWCIGGVGGWGPMVDVRAGSAHLIGGDGEVEFGLVGRDVRAVTVHLTGGLATKTKLHDSIFSFSDHGRHDVAYYIVTRKDGTTLRLTN